MEENNNTTLVEKMKSAINNIRQMMLSDKRVFSVVAGITVLVVVFIILLSVSVFAPRKRTVTTDTPNTTVTQNSRRSIIPTSKPKIPTYLSLVLSNPQKTYKVNDTITFTIMGDSGGQQLRGYDAVFKFDRRKVSFINEKNLYPSFDYRRRIRGDWVIITSTESLSSKKKTAIFKTPLMKVSFKAVAPGTAYFPMSYIPDSFNDSNLIGINSNDMLTKADGISVQITQ
jgi:hypothetical protein